MDKRLLVVAVDDEEFVASGDDIVSVNVVTGVGGGGVGSLEVVEEAEEVDDDELVSNMEVLSVVEDSVEVEADEDDVVREVVDDVSLFVVMSEEMVV